jgi:aromatic ring-cleaving dioxygenase
MGTTTHYHSHVYFGADTIEKAKSVCELVAKKFDVQIGRFWERNVGPHPRWSVQILYEANKFGRVVPFLMKNREGLTIFTHPLTGDDLKDHTDHALWMGELLELNLQIFEP